MQKASLGERDRRFVFGLMQWKKNMIVKMEEKCIGNDDDINIDDDVGYIACKQQQEQDKIKNFDNECCGGDYDDDDDMVSRFVSSDEDEDDDIDPTITISAASTLIGNTINPNDGPSSGYNNAHFIDDEFIDATNVIVVDDDDSMSLESIAFVDVSNFNKTVEPSSKTDVGSNNNNNTNNISNTVVAPAYKEEAFSNIVNALSLTSSLPDDLDQQHICPTTIDYDDDQSWIDSLLDNNNDATTTSNVAELDTNVFANDGGAATSFTNNGTSMFSGETLDLLDELIRENEIINNSIVCSSASSISRSSSNSSIIDVVTLPKVEVVAMPPPVTMTIKKLKSPPLTSRNNNIGNITRKITTSTTPRRKRKRLTCRRINKQFFEPGKALLWSSSPANVEYNNNNATHSNMNNNNNENMQSMDVDICNMAHQLGLAEINHHPLAMASTSATGIESVFKHLVGNMPKESFETLSQRYESKLQMCRTRPWVRYADLAAIDTLYTRIIGVYHRNRILTHKLLRHQLKLVDDLRCIGKYLVEKHSNFSR